MRENFYTAKNTGKESNAKVDKLMKDHFIEENVWEKAS